MFQMKKGCKVPHPEKISEGYELQDYQIVANVGADKIREIFSDFLAEHDEPLFLVLEIPTNLADLPKGENDAFTDVYYWDGMEKRDCLGLFKEYGDLLFEDGMLRFGFGGHFSQDEIMWGNYNLLTFYSSEPQTIVPILQRRGIPRAASLVTAWETFSEKHFGVCEALKGEVTIYDLATLLKPRGLYFAERRKDF